MGKYREPQSANEAALQNILGEQNELREPQSVTEFYLKEILEKGGGGGGGSGEGIPTIRLKEYEGQYCMIEWTGVLPDVILVYGYQFKSLVIATLNHTSVVLCGLTGRVYQLVLRSITETSAYFIDDSGNPICPLHANGAASEYSLRNIDSVAPSFPTAEGASSIHALFVAKENGKSAMYYDIDTLNSITGEPYKLGNKFVDLNKNNLGEQLVALVTAVISALANADEIAIGSDYGAQGLFVFGMYASDLLVNLKNGINTIVKYGTYTSQITATNYVADESSELGFDKASCMFTIRQTTNNTLYDVDIVFDLDVSNNKCMVVGHGKKTAITIIPMS